MGTLGQDVRHSLRIFARHPGPMSVAVATLALALGANTAVFSLMNGVLLRALPYSEPDRILDVSVLLPPVEGHPGREAFLDHQQFQAWNASTRTLEPLAAYRLQTVTLSGQASPERLTVASASPALFPLLRASPARGRAFREEEQQPGRDRVALLAHPLWQRRFGADPGIVGKAVVLDGLAYTVVGVMPAGFSFPRPEVQLWMPLAVAAEPSAEVIEVQYDPVVARLRDGVSLAQAEAEGQALLQGEGDAAPGAEGGLPAERIRLVPLRDAMVGPVRPAMLAMFGAVGLVLLISCINLAHLLLARNAARQREMAIRSALGGDRARLVRQMLTESTVLSLAGGLAGMILAGGFHRLLPRWLPGDLPRLEEVRLDGRVFLFALALAGLTGLAFGLLPALRGAGASLAAPLRAGTAGRARDARSRSLLVVAEVALACILLVGAGLLLRSYLHLLDVDLGYAPDHVLSATVALDPNRYGTPAEATAFFDQLLERVGEHRGVAAAGVVSFPPLTASFTQTSLAVLGEPPGKTLAVPQLTSPGYLEALGMKLAAGRWLTRQDLATEAPVAVVNQTFARRYVTGPRVLGRRLRVGAATLEIVGVVQDVSLLGPDSAPRPELFASFSRAEALPGGSPQRISLLARTSGEPKALLPFLRTQVLALDPALALEDVRTMEVKLAAARARPRFYALLLGVFAGTALVLAAAGIYGVLSYSVSRQTRAIGVRRALGAQEAAILSMVLREGLLLVAAGLALGMAVAAGATRILVHLLFGVTAGDPLSYCMAALSLLSVAALACYLPARSALRVDAIAALRDDG